MSVLPPRPLRLSADLYRETATGLAVLGVLCVLTIAGGASGLTDAASLVSAGGFLVLVGSGLLGLFGWSAAKKHRHARACAQDSVEITLDVVAIRKLRTVTPGAVIFEVLYAPQSGDGDMVRARIAPHEPLLVLRDGAPKLVALVSPKFPHDPLILTKSVYQFRLTPEQGRAISDQHCQPTEEWTAPGWSEPSGA